MPSDSVKLELQSMGEWARTVQQKYQPPQADFNDLTLEVVAVAGAFAADVILPGNVNLLVLTLGAVGQNKSVIEGLIYVFAKQSTGMAAQLAVKRAIPTGMIANALEHIGVDPAAARTYDQRMRSALEGVIVEILEEWLKSIEEIFFDVRESPEVQ